MIKRGENVSNYSTFNIEMKVKLDYLSFTSSVADTTFEKYVNPDPACEIVRIRIRLSRVNTWSNFETELLVHYSIFRNFDYTFFEDFWMRQVSQG